MPKLSGLSERYAETMIRQVKQTPLVGRMSQSIATLYNQAVFPAQATSGATYLVFLLPGLLLFGLGIWPLLGVPLAPMPWLTALTGPTGYGAHVDAFFQAGFTLTGAMLVATVLVRPFAILALCLVLGRLLIERGAAIALGETLIALAILMLIRSRFTRRG